MKISVVMPCFGRANKTRQALDRLLKFSPASLVEVIAVNDGSADHTARVLREFEDRIRIVTREKNGGIARAVSDGWRVADPASGVLMKLDNDVLLQSPGWHSAITAAVRELGSLGIIGFPVAPVWDFGMRPGVIPGTRYRWKRVVRACVNGAAWAIPRPVFEQIGWPWIPPFPYSGFDGEYATRVRASGLKTGYILGEWAKQISPTDAEAPYEKWKKRSHQRNGPAYNQRMAAIGRGEIYVPPYWEKPK